jgi:hypothetical protein
MQGAPHSLFHWDDSASADAHPNVSDALARAAAAAFMRDGIPVSDVDLWRDVGWCFVAKSDGRAFEIYYTVQVVLPAGVRGALVEIDLIAVRPK